MMKGLFIIIFLSLLLPVKVYAQSSYVLPYPSTMPGNISYKIHLVYEEVSKSWYFGDFGKFKYNLKYANKYLAESKTLFEYRQYLLGYKALGKSNYYFIKIHSSLVNAKKNGKNTQDKEAILFQAAEKHIEVLSKLAKELPKKIIWKPEKEKESILDLEKEIHNAISIRQKYL